MNDPAGPKPDGSYVVLLVLLPGENPAAKFYDPPACVLNPIRNLFLKLQIG